VERVVVRGAELAVERRGAGPHFVWAHGLTSARSHEDARRLFDWSALAAERTVIRYDARGHGESSATPDPADYRWDNLAADLLGLLDALALRQVDAGGASMGCATVLHAATVAPDRFNRLVLVVPPTAWETRAAQAEMYEAGTRIIETQGAAAFAEVSAARPVAPIFEEEPEMARFDPAIAESALPTVLRGAAASDLPAPDRIAALGHPTLILAWDTDPGHPVSTAQRLADLLPYARLHVARSVAEIRAWPEAVRAFLDRP
jgi:3-oxoadipate enol-lactonase